MPIIEYLTESGRKVERVYLAGDLKGQAPPREIDIDGETARRIMSAPVVRYRWRPPVMDRADQVFEGTGIQTDGINPLRYASHKTVVDMGDPKAKAQTTAYSPPPNRSDIDYRSHGGLK